MAECCQNAAGILTYFKVVLARLRREDFVLMHGRELSEVPLYCITKPCLVNLAD